MNILPIYILVHGGCGPDSEYVPHLYILVYGGRGLTGVNTAVEKKKKNFHLVCKYDTNITYFDFPLLAVFLWYA